MTQSLPPSRAANAPFLAKLQTLLVLWLWSAIAALITFFMLISGGVVTGLEAGLAVPDWPNSYGHNMLLYPLAEMTSDLEKEESSDVISKIKEVLDAKVRPAVARDGGDITFKSFKDGIVTVELKGSCSGCPSSVMTLKQGVQNLLCHYIPEVKSVEAK